MDFLKRLKSKIHHYQNKDFRKEIQATKKKTYLFQDYKESFSTSRIGFFRKKQNILRPFSNIFQNIERVQSKHSHVLNIIGLVLIGLSVYIIFFSPYFEITPSRVMIEGLDTSIDTNISYQAIEEIYGTNIFLIEKSSVLGALKKYQKQIASIELDYLYPNSIKILIRSLPIAFKTSIYGLDTSWGMTSNGVLIPVAKSGSGLTEVDGIEIISSRLRETIFLDYKDIIASEVVTIIKRTLEIIRTDFTDFQLAKSRYLESEQELHITLESGVRIFLTLDGSLKNQLLSLRTYALAHRDVFLSGDVTYVDARVGGKIFICQEKITCKANMENIYGPIYE